MLDHIMVYVQVSGQFCEPGFSVTFLQFLGVGFKSSDLCCEAASYFPHWDISQDPFLAIFTKGSQRVRERSEVWILLKIICKMSFSMSYQVGKALSQRVLGLPWCPTAEDEGVRSVTLKIPNIHNSEFMDIFSAGKYLVIRKWIMRKALDFSWLLVWAVCYKSEQLIRPPFSLQMYFSSWI